MRELLVDTGALDLTERMIDRLTGQACAALDAAPVQGAAREVLAALALCATRRVA